MSLHSVARVGNIFVSNAREPLSSLTVSHLALIVATYVVTRLAVRGLSAVMGLDCMRHGTLLSSYIGIRLLGGLPRMGGYFGGATHADKFNDDVKGKFYMTNDSRQMPAHARSYPLKIFIGLYQAGYSRYLPKYFQFLACRGRTNNLLTFIPRYLWAIVNVILVPSISIHRTPAQNEKYLQRDPKAPNDAKYTECWVDPTNMGLLGVIRNGLNPFWLHRAITYPSKVLTGMIQLSTAIALASLCMHYMPSANHGWLKISAVAGLILA